MQIPQILNLCLKPFIRPVIHRLNRSQGGHDSSVCVQVLGNANKCFLSNHFVKHTRCNKVNQVLVLQGHTLIWQYSRVLVPSQVKAFPNYLEMELCFHIDSQDRCAKNCSLGNIGYTNPCFYNSSIEVQEIKDTLPRMPR